MAVRVQRVRDRVIVIGNPGLEVRMPGGGAAANWWDPNNEGLCVWSAYQPKGAASFAASILDLSGNGNNAGDPGGASTPGWTTADGWDFRAGLMWLTTTFIPQNDQSQTILCQFTNYNTAQDRRLFGVENGGAARAVHVRPNENLLNRVQYANGGAVSAVPSLAAGNLGMAGGTGYRDGVANGLIPPWGGASTNTLFIGAYNNAGGGPAGYAEVIIPALVIYDCVLTAPQVLAIATAMAAL